MIRILLADESPVVRAGLNSIFIKEPDFVVIGEADSPETLLEATRLQTPDVVLLDLCIRRYRIESTVDSIRQTNPHLRFLIFTTFGGADEILMAARSRMHGYALKTDTPADLVAAIRTVYRGERWFSPALELRVGDSKISLSLSDREREVLNAIASGKTNQEVSDALFISESTVKFHVSHILTKLGATDRTEAVVIGLERGLLRLSEKFR